MHDADTFKKDIQENYDVEEELGSGQFAVVRKLVEKETGDEFAGKYVRKKRTKASRNGMSREDIKREIEILRMFDSEKIIKVHDVYETDREMILIMELLRGGELFDYISKKDFLTEEEAIDFTRQILQGLQHLHSRNVVHLDLKPENILLKNTRRKTIKLVDFGLARVVKQNEQVREIMGTPEFVAPEVLNFDTISTATDMWALGVIAYILLSGASPFLGDDNQETFTNIIQVDYQFDEEYFSEISDEAKDFIQKLLVKDPRKRPTAHDCSRHTWVEEVVTDKKKRQRRRTTQICTFNFKRFVARKRWKMSYNKIRAMNMIAKMGIKPPPGFISEIPPMDSDVSLETSQQKEDASLHKEEHREQKKDHKKNTTINRRKHKQNSTPKQPVEKTDSLTLKTMDIDIGEGDNVGSGNELAQADSEAVIAAESSPPFSEPVDYGSMTKRQKRRARGQLRHDEIAISQVMDAKKSKSGDEEETPAEQNDAVSIEMVKEAEPEPEPEPEPEIKSKPEIKSEPEIKPEPELEREPEKPAEVKNVTSTVHIEHKPKTGGILKKREVKAARIPSTEDHYLVTLNAALLEQAAETSPQAEKDAPKPKPSHGILKPALRKTSRDELLDHSNNLEANAKLHQETVSGFNIEVAVASKEARPPREESPVGHVVASRQESTDNGEVFEKEPELIEEKKVETGVDREERKMATKNSGRQSASTDDVHDKNVSMVTPKKKSLSKEDNTQPQQKRFTPPPWKTQQRSSSENLKPKPLHGVSKVSLKTNRFLSNDQASTPKSPTSGAGVKTSNVLGKSKLFQKENTSEKKSQDLKKVAATKTNSLGEELKTVACDINLDEPAKPKTSRGGGKWSGKDEVIDTKVKEESREGKGNNVERTKPRSGSHPKPRAGSAKDHINNNNNIENKPSKTAGNGTRSRSGSSRSTKENAEEDRKLNHVNSKTSNVPGNVVVNGENTGARAEPLKNKSSKKVEKIVYESTVEISVDKEEEVTELRSSSTHSLTEFTIRPRENSKDEKGAGFDVTLTIGPQEQPTTHESRVVKSRFASSSSSALVGPKAELRNGKLTSASAIDVTNHSRETAHITTTTIERHGVPLGQKSAYTSQRDFSKYLAPEHPTKTPSKTFSKTSETPPNNSKSVVHQQPAVIVKRPAPGNSTTTGSGRGKKPQAISTTVYVPRRTFGFSAKPATHTEAEDTRKKNNNDQSKRWSHSSNASDRSASSASSEESLGCPVSMENDAEVTSNARNKNSNTGRKIEDYTNSGHSPHSSPVLGRKWKATLVVPDEAKKIPSAKDRDVRITSSNARGKKNFTNVRSMFESK